MKFNKYIIAVVALLVASVSLEAQTPQNKSFLNGYNLSVALNSTNTYGGTNIYANGYTMTNSGTYPYVQSYSPTMKTNTAAFGDVDLWANSDGSVALTTINFSFVGQTVGFTNTALVKFAAIPDFTSTGNPLLTNSPATQAQNLFSFSVTGNGTTPVCLSTNVPLGLLQGQRRLRCTGIEWTNSGTNGVVIGLSLSGFTPK